MEDDIEITDITFRSYDEFKGYACFNVSYNEILPHDVLIWNVIQVYYYDDDSRIEFTMKNKDRKLAGMIESQFRSYIKNV